MRIRFLIAATLILPPLARRSPPDGATLRERLGSVRRMAESCVGMVRNMALLLRPSMLDDLGLIPALRWQAREVTRRLGVQLVVNDRPDLAVLAEADYAHVGQEDLPVAAVRQLGLRVGQSTHSADELDRTEADYAGVGPVYSTPTKEGRPAVGLELVRHQLDARGARGTQ